jgi:polyribonucleotide nucleotidyltransferase
VRLKQSRLFYFYFFAMQVLPGLQGLVHVSELHTKRVVSVEGFTKVGERMDVKLLGVNEKGQLRLSRKVQQQQ